MAADRPLTERRIVEIKMGRSKFPGKPSKIGNRKRVNLSSCALPEENDSSKAAENIYLGLSVFNETFGDNEMVAPGPFHGFSMLEVEEAMAEARLQQREAELEHKKQGIHINLWEEFQNELFSIGSCSKDKSNDKSNSCEINKTKQCFDGGGSGKEKDTISSIVDCNSAKPSKIIEPKSIEINSYKSCKRLTIFKSKGIHVTPDKKFNRSTRFVSPTVKLFKLPISPTSVKSLQSQAAKKLLEKAKKSNLLESSKNTAIERKFILPSHSVHSSRVIKPNKRFLEDDDGKKQKLLRSRSIKCSLEAVLMKRPKFSKFGVDNKHSRISSSNFHEIDLKACTGETKKKCVGKSNECSPVKISDEKGKNNKMLQESPKSSSQVSSSGKVILREARLQLDKNNLGLMEGPFSSNSFSVSPNSPLKVNSVQSGTIGTRTIVCGVCGAVRFYRFVKQARKFGIYCCESCRKFISKMIRVISSDKNAKLQCQKGKGLCAVPGVVRSQHWSLGKCAYNARCQACWLKLCLKSFKMPLKIKEKLSKLLPSDRHFSINIDSGLVISKDISSKFMVGDNNAKDFKWLHENLSSTVDTKSNSRSTFGETSILQSDKSSTIINSKDETVNNRRKGLRTKTKKKVLKFSEKKKLDVSEKNRQLVDLKGPRVKHVCRSASVVLGQPIATFPSEPSPTKKPVSDFNDNCKNCDKLDTTSSNTESQGNVVDKPNKNTTLNEVKQSNIEKKSNVNSKQVTIGKSSGLMQPTAKSKRKGAAKAENMISMDFWESYDPDEICETGFGLIGSEPFTCRALCFLCGSSGQEKLIHCASCGEPYHEFCIDDGQLKLEDGTWRFDWVCPRCTICVTCGKSSGQHLKCIRCDNSYHAECVDRVGGRLLHSPDRPWVCSVCLRCKSCNGVDVSVFVGNLPLCKPCFVLRQKGNYCPLCQRCYEDDDYDSKMMECGQCQCWVHAKCEGLSDEKYQVLSFLPESVEFICRMCCVMPPAPWWVAVEAELKSGYLGVLKTLSKNRKACAMLKWSPRKQCTCRQLNFIPRALDFEDSKSIKNINEKTSEDGFNKGKLSCEIKTTESEKDLEEEKFQPATISERKASIEVINHPTESLKLTLKIMKGAENEEKHQNHAYVNDDNSGYISRIKNISINKEGGVRVKKCISNEESSVDSNNSFYYHDDSQASLQSLFKSNDFNSSTIYQPDKRSLSSPLNPPSDSGIGSTDDELKANCLTDEETCRLDDPQSTKCSNSNILDSKPSDTSTTFLDEKRDCFCFLEVDTYNSRSKPFSPNLLSIKKKVTTSEYSSLQQFHQDMQRMIETTQSVELMEVYHQTMKEIFPWFDPKFSRVYNNSQKVFSSENTPVKSTPTKKLNKEACIIPKEKLIGRPLDYFYSGFSVDDTRMCLMCKTLGDGLPSETGRLIYCGQNEWVHCNCALWSGEVFEEIDGSLQNVHSAINRGRSIRCPECNLKGASIGCCARNCQETYHFSCAKKAGCIFMDDKTLYCVAHSSESAGKLVQNEQDFEIRRPVYVELDKRKMKSAESNLTRVAVGSLHVENLGRFVLKLSDHMEAILPADFQCTRWFWSCFEPWRIVRYHFTVRLLEVEQTEGVDLGVNFTVDHTEEPELVDLKLKQLKYFQEHHQLLEVNEKLIEEKSKEKRKLNDIKLSDDLARTKLDDVKQVPFKRPKKDDRVVRKIFDHLDSKDDENCLSDNQNTADLLPPDIEEAIFKDLPHDILDGISMQDIFMDIKNEPFEQNDKESKDENNDDSSEVEVISSEGQISDKSKKSEYNEVSGNGEFWMLQGDSKSSASEVTDELINSKLVRELKRSKSDVLPNQFNKKSSSLKNHQRSCSLNWNCKLDGSANKWKRNSKCQVTVNLLESQDRSTNKLQELKFADGLVTVSTGAIETVKELKARLDESRRAVQQEEGKENKCLSWHARLQPRLLQVDGGVDSSSSGSEAGESPQRFIDENLSNVKVVLPPQTSPYSHSLSYPSATPCYSPNNSQCHNLQSSICPSFPEHYSNTHFPSDVEISLPQIDGANDSSSDFSDIEDFVNSKKKLQKRTEVSSTKSWIKNHSQISWFKITQCDGSIDSEAEGGASPKRFHGSNEDEDDDLGLPLGSTLTKDEPVKCSQCHCTYRTKVSYQRHLENCCNDFMLSSSEGEMSEEEGSKKPPEEVSEVKQVVTVPNVPIASIKTSVAVPEIPTSPVSKGMVSMPSSTSNLNTNQDIKITNKIEVKKPKAAKPRTYTRRKGVTNVVQPQMVTNTQQLQQILLHQQNGIPPALIVQDVPNSNVVPTAFLEPAPALQYVTAIDHQSHFAKPQLIATPNPLIPGTFQIQPSSESQLIGGLSVLPQSIPTNMPGIIIQPPQPTNTLLTSQPGPIVMAGEQMMLGSTPMFEILQDPQTGGMFLASHNQPLFYNMETIVSNTVMQTNQFVSNMMATSSYSQTSTQVFQASKLEQVVNVPSNFIMVNPNSSMTDKIISSNNIICVQTPNPLITNTPQLQLAGQPLVNSSLIRPPQPFNTEPKVTNTPSSPLRCIQPYSKPLPMKQISPRTFGTKVRNHQAIDVPSHQIVRFPDSSHSINVTNQANRVVTNSVASSVIRPNATKNGPKTYEKAQVAVKSKQQHQPRSRALVDYINNFKSDTCDINYSVTSASTLNVQENIDIVPSSNMSLITENMNSFSSNVFNENREGSYSSPKRNFITSSHLPPIEENSFSQPIECSSATNISTSNHIPKSSPIDMVHLTSASYKSSESEPPTLIPPIVSSSNIEVSKPSFSVMCPDIPTFQSWSSTNISSDTISTSSASMKNIQIATAASVVTPAASPTLHSTANKTENPYPYDKELKLSISMPSLDDSPPTSQVDVPQADNESSTIAPLPLQDNFQSINSKNIPKSSPQKTVSHFPSSIARNTAAMDENIKAKKKIDSSDQNCIATKLVTIHPRLVQQEQILSEKTKNGKSFQSKLEEKGPKLIFDVTSDDGFKSSSTSMVELWANICDSVQEMRAVFKIPPLPISRKGHEVLGMQNHGLQHCLEQLRGVEQCIRYKCKYFLKEGSQKGDEDGVISAKENLSGCARTESFTQRKEHDMFAWLASRHRRLPKLKESAEESLSSNRRANSLPMAMRYRHLRETSKLYVGVYRSKIHGKGLFCLREIEAGEMVIEYAGEVIRSNLTDKREKYYTDKGIGCYMFRIDDHFVVDATMKGNAARFINHSCEPNCYSRVVDILGKKHIVIFALRRINIMEELTYDYKFPFEDEKISCHCLSKKCRKYLN